MCAGTKAPAQLKSYVRHERTAPRAHVLDMASMIMIMVAIGVGACSISERGLRGQTWAHARECWCRPDSIILTGPVCPRPSLCTCDSSWIDLPPRAIFIDSSRNPSEYSTKLSTTRRKKDVVVAWNACTHGGPLIGTSIQTILCLEKCRRLSGQWAKPPSPLALSLSKKQRTGTSS